MTKKMEARVAEIGARLEAHEEHCRERNATINNQFSMLFRRIHWLTGIFLSTSVAVILRVFN